MSKIDSNNILLREQLGKGDIIIFTPTTEKPSSIDFYAIHFIQESVISNITLANATGSSYLNGLTIAAGTVIFGRCTSINLTSGVAIGYSEHDKNPTK